MNEDPQNIQLKYMRRLMFALMASGTINIVLLSIFFYWLIKDNPSPAYFEKKPALLQEQQAPLASERGNAELVHYFRSLTFEQLVAKLSNNQLIEDGYTQRDIALACLVAFHHFDLSRALLGHELSMQQRAIAYGQLKSGQPATITVYPGLSDEQFRVIFQFIEMERWPLTSKGLFLQLKKFSDQVNLTLKDAFFMTSEFLAIELLFNRVDHVALNKDELLQMILEGSWSLLSDFVEQQKLIQDLSSARRQRLLLEYIDQKSIAAAYIMLKVDGEFALKKLDDRHVVELLALLNEKTPESEKFAMDLLTSPRGDNVWKSAGTLLFQYVGETIPSKNVHHLAMKRFISEHALIDSLAETTPKVVIPKKTVEVSLPPSSSNKKTTGEVVTTKLAPSKSSTLKTVASNSTPKPSNSSVKKNASRMDRLYIVQEGDSLWKISRRFNVDMDMLRDHNKLKSDALKPGTPIRIPFQ